MIGFDVNVAEVGTGWGGARFNFLWGNLPTLSASRLRVGMETGTPPGMGRILLVIVAASP